MFGAKAVIIINLINFGFKVYREGMHSWGLSIIVLTLLLTVFEFVSYWISDESFENKNRK